MEAYQNPYFYGAFSDDYFYDIRWPKKYLQRNTLNYFEIYSAIGYSHNSPLFVYIVALLYRFGQLLDGYDTMLPRLLNMFFLAQTGGIAFRFLTKTANVTASSASRIVFVMCLFPSRERAHRRSACFRPAIFFLTWMAITPRSLSGATIVLILFVCHPFLWLTPM